jgi:GNAT superfamily N-acetyltransferase
VKDTEEKANARLSTVELDRSTWHYFDDLFRRNKGVWGGCWCTYYHAPRGAPWSAGPGNRKTKEELLSRGEDHGIIVLNGEVPRGWCQFGPKEELPRMDGRKGYEAPAGPGVWRVTCFFVDKGSRRRGVATKALSAAIASMEKEGAKLVEAYPVETGRGRTSANMLWSGTPSMFESFGFKKTRKLGKSTWVMSKELLLGR